MNEESQEGAFKQPSDPQDPSPQELTELPGDSRDGQMVEIDVENDDKPPEEPEEPEKLEEPPETANRGLSPPGPPGPPGPPAPENPPSSLAPDPAAVPGSLEALWLGMTDLDSVMRRWLPWERCYRSDVKMGRSTKDVDFIGF